MATKEMWSNLAELQPRVQSAESVSKEDYLIGLCNQLKEKIPEQTNMLVAQKKYKEKI